MPERCDLTEYPNLKLYAMPGGDAYYMQWSLGSKGKQNIKNFLNSGGAYYGVCAGWFYTMEAYYWQGSRYVHRDMLGLLEDGEGSITDLADYESDSPFKVTGTTAGADL